MLHDVRIGAEATDKIRIGIDKAANIIKTTMGPMGHHVSIDFDQFSWPLTTNDGVTVANNTFLKDKFENIGAKYVRQAAQKTNDIAGDGTTTASVLVQAIVNEGYRLLSAGVSAVTLRREIESAIKLVFDDLNKQTVIIKQDDIKSLTDIAAISSRDEALGGMIAKLVAEIGADGVITIEDSGLAKTEVARTEGLRVNGGLLSPFFVNHRAFQQAVYNDVPIVVTDYSITQPGEVVRIMEQLAQAGKKQGVLIANNVDGAALQNIIQNRIKGNFDLLPLRVISYGPIGEGYVRDICAATGATLLSERDGKQLKDFTFSDAGLVGTLAASAHVITLMDGGGDTQARIEELQAQLPNVKALEEESLKERIAKLQSKTASIKVGGVIDSEREEVKKRVEDAVNATKAALSTGIVTGGGAALYRAASRLAGDDYGTRVVSQALKYPLRQIATNADIELDKGDLQAVVDNTTKTFDFRTGEVVDAYNSGVIDPALVVKTALVNAASAAIMFLITDAAIVTIEDNGEEL
ncbi:MAG: chaperonin GroEL [Patescibacteria group bacterium]|nr:chaperonin GroEL [Patescibacteria group bacterium]